MKSCNKTCYESIKKALKRVGFKVDEILKQDNKTVITVFHCKTGDMTAVSPEKQRVNND